MGPKNYTWEARGGTVARKIPGLRKGSESPSFLEPRRVAEKAPAAVVQEAHQRRRDNVPASLKTCSKLFPDETTVRVPDPGPGTTKTGHVWTQARDDRPRGRPDSPGVVYSHAPGRGGRYRACGIGRVSRAWSTSSSS